MKPDKWTNIIRYLSLILVFGLAIGAFAQSYAALWGTALTYGLSPKLAWFWPLLVDGAIIVFSLAVVRNGLLGEKVWWPWLLVCLFTLGTIVLNGLHSDGHPVAIAVAVVAPIALVLAFETSMAMVKSDVRRSGAVQSIAQIEAERDKKATELDRLQHDRLAEIEALAQARQTELDSLLLSRQNELATLEAKLGKLQEEVEAKANALNSYAQDVEAKKQELKGLTEGLTKIYLPANLTLEQKRGLANHMASDGLTNEQIAAALGVSLATVKNYKAANKQQIVEPTDIPFEAGHRNGHKRG